MTERKKLRYRAERQAIDCLQTEKRVMITVIFIRERKFKEKFQGLHEKASGT